MTLSSAVRQGGLALGRLDVPADTEDWPEGQRFYRWRAATTTHATSDYEGPKFGYARMPDQFALDAFRRLRARPARPGAGDGRDRPRVQPQPVGAAAPDGRPGDELGDGSVFDGMPEEGQQRGRGLARRRPGQGGVRAVARSTPSTRSPPSSSRAHDDDLVLVVLGDHWPRHHRLRDEHAGHDVPISVIAHDPAVLHRIGGWGWQDGLRPARPTRPCGRWTPSATGSWTPSAADELARASSCEDRAGRSSLLHLEPLRCPRAGVPVVGRHAVMRSRRVPPTSPSPGTDPPSRVNTMSCVVGRRGAAVLASSSA